MAGKLPNRKDLFLEIRTKYKGLKFVLGEELREATRACLVELVLGL